MKRQTRVDIACLRGVALALLALVGGCANDGGRTRANEPLLNSDRIESRFGSYGVEVLEQGSVLRVANLFSLSDSGDKICRTFAVTQLLKPVAAPLASIHESIVSGRSIGKAMRQGGWGVRKKPMHVGSINSPGPKSRINSLMKSQATSFALYVYELSVTKAEDTFAYAVIAELYHPDYLDVDGTSAIVSETPGHPVPDALHQAILASIR